ncbi:MAG: hypothetical protein V7K57_14035 [Nostoc sp.]
MVRELEKKRQSAKFPETAPAANPVFFRTYSRRTKAGLRETWDEVCDRTLQCLHGKLVAQANFLPTVTTGGKSGYINKQSRSGVSQAPRLTRKFKNIERTELMMKPKFPSTIQPHLKVKAMKTKRTAPKEPFLKKLPKPVINATFIASVTALVIPLSALGVLALSKCGTLHVQLSPFELQLIKGSCTPSDRQMK